jgi:hypothetical protein
VRDAGGAVVATASDSADRAAKVTGQQCVLSVDDGRETCFASTTKAASFRSTGGVPFHIHVRLGPWTGYDGVRFSGAYSPATRTTTSS